MSDFRTGYLYSLSPVHCGGEGDIGNIQDIVREAHTDFPYIPGSSLRGKIRNEVKLLNETAANKLFGQELAKDGSMGVHQVWFGDARLLWVPMRTLDLNNHNKSVFTWVSCHSLLRDHAIAAQAQVIPDFPEYAAGTSPGRYLIADAEIQVREFEAKAEGFQSVITLQEEKWPNALKQAVCNHWKANRIILPDSDFQILMEHALWTQIRNKIEDGDLESEESTQSAQDNSERSAQDASEQSTQGDSDKPQTGGAGIFWTDICIPRDTIFYFTWGYRLLPKPLINNKDNNSLKQVISGLVQVGGQANVGRGWVQTWVNNDSFTPLKPTSDSDSAV
jgi:CRISPR-associated protein Cmr4